MPGAIVIKRTEVFTRGVNRPFKWVYRVEAEGNVAPILNDAGVQVNFEGTPLASIRRIAKVLASSRNFVPVREDWV